MNFKDTLKKELANKDKIIELRYKSSKLTFVLITLLFFISFFLYGAGLFPGFLLDVVSVLYILLIISLFIFLYFSAKNLFKTKIKGNFEYLLIIVLVILLITFMLPVITKGGILGLLK